MRFQCTKCKGIVAIDDEDMGQPVSCGHCNEVVIVPETHFSPTAVLSDFVIMHELGKGGMGVVYLAHQLSLDREVALKVLMREYSDNSEFITDFVREARAAARLNHPNIVQAYAVSEDDGTYYLAMEYIEGTSLSEILMEQQTISVEFALNIVHQITEALKFAWENMQLVHRDIKPDNILLTKKNVAKLSDLGLAKIASDIGDDDSDNIQGTPQYICPEQLLGTPMDIRGDLYSLGATFYQAITGRFPFTGDTAADIARKHLKEPLTSPDKYNPEIPISVCRIIEKMMAKHPDDRYLNAASLIKDIKLAKENKGKKVSTKSKKLKSSKSTSMSKNNISNSNGAQTSAPETSIPKAKSKTIRKGPGSTSIGGKKTLSLSSNKKTSRPSASKTKFTTNPRDEEYEEDYEEEYDNDTNAPIEKRSHTGLIAGVLAVIFLLVGGGIAVLMNIKKKEYAQERTPAEKMLFSRMSDIAQKEYLDLNDTGVLLDDSIKFMKKFPSSKNFKEVKKWQHDANDILLVALRFKKHKTYLAKEKIILAKEKEDREIAALLEAEKQKNALLAKQKIAEKKEKIKREKAAIIQFKKIRENLIWEMLDGPLSVYEYRQAKDIIKQYYLSEIKEIRKWSTTMTVMIQNAKSTHSLVAGTGIRHRNKALRYRNIMGKIANIKENEIAILYTDPRDHQVKEKSRPFPDLEPMEFWSLIKDKAQNEQGRFNFVCYLFSIKEFKTAGEFLKDIDNEHKELLSGLIINLAPKHYKKEIASFIARLEDNIEQGQRKKALRIWSIYKRKYSWTDQWAERKDELNELYETAKKIK